MKPKVFLTTKMLDKGLDILCEKCELHLWENVTRPTKSDIIREIKGCSAIVVIPGDIVDQEVMASASELKVVGFCAVGYDSVDLKEATRKGIFVTNTPDVLTDTTADMAFSLLMAVARRVGEGERLVRSGEWKAGGLRFMLGYDVSGASLGIVGLGRIGGAVAKRGMGFGMDMYYTNRSARPDLESSMGVKKLPLEELLKTCDFVSLNCPLTSETDGLIGEKELRMMKKNAILINTARGKVIDQNALCKALQEGWIAGAGLDVFTPEPLPIDSPLVKMDNVVLTPHIGSATYQTREKMSVMTAESIIDVLEGRNPKFLVNKELKTVS